MDAAKVKSLSLVRIFLAILVLSVMVPATAVMIKPALLEPLLIAEPSAGEADALVVMAGSRYQRLPATARLYHQGVAPRILLTNDGIFAAWSSKHQRNLYHVEWAREYLLEQGVPDTAIEMLDFIESGSYFDALSTRNHALAAGTIRSLLVVTSDYHTRRTLWIFKQVFAGMDIGIGIYPVPQDPNYEGRRLRVLTTELVKLVYYRLRYGLLPVL